MKIRLLLALAGLATGFALPTFAQQINTPGSQLHQQVVAVDKRFDDAVNNADSAVLAALFTEDAVILTDTGPVYGRPAIQKWYADLFQQWHPTEHLVTVDQNAPHIIGMAGNEIWSNGEIIVTLQGQNGGPFKLKGYWVAIEKLEGGDWKKQMLMWKNTPVAPAQTK
jgi:ketosteroid isomerase-like protein